MAGSRWANPQRRIAAIWAAVACAGLAGVLYPWLGGVDMMTRGYAIVLFSVLVALTGVTAAALFARRAATLDAMVSGKDLLATWSYAPEQWNAFAGEEYRLEKGAKRGLFLVVAVSAVVIGLGFAFFAPDREAGRMVLVLMLGLIVVIGVVALLSVRFSPWRSRGHRVEARISMNGIAVNGVLHTWGTAGAQLVRAEILAEPGPVLEVEYSFPTAAGPDSATVRVPIPEGAEAEARELTVRLQGR